MIEKSKQFYQCSQANDDTFIVKQFRIEDKKVCELRRWENLRFSQHEKALAEGHFGLVWFFFFFFPLIRCNGIEPGMYGEERGAVRIGDCPLFWDKFRVCHRLNRFNRSSEGVLNLQKNIILNFFIFVNNCYNFRREGDIVS